MDKMERVFQGRESQEPINPQAMRLGSDAREETFILRGCLSRVVLGSALVIEPMFPMWPVRRRTDS